ncbi:hypothetical protein HDU76_003767 [Blyttiomyces sp. JEL0837]|nr:hypothetical protein HDU76_003767 [Blyttiomyces sp. JEL0837]
MIASANIRINNSNSSNSTTTSTSPVPIRAPPILRRSTRLKINETTNINSPSTAPIHIYTTASLLEEFNLTSTSSLISEEQQQQQVEVEEMATATMNQQSPQPAATNTEDCPICLESLSSTTVSLTKFQQPSNASCHTMDPNRIYTSLDEMIAGGHEFAAAYSQANLMQVGENGGGNAGGNGCGGIRITPCCLKSFHEGCLKGWWDFCGSNRFSGNGNGGTIVRACPYCRNQGGLEFVNQYPPWVNTIKSNVDSVESLSQLSRIRRVWKKGSF